MNSFIVTAKGFLKEIVFDRIKLEYQYSYTDKLRDAKQYSTKTAKGALKTHKLEGFVYKPWEEEPVRASYEVVKLYDSPLFAPRKMFMNSNSDAKFLANKTIVAGMTFSEAKQLTLIKNRALVDELLAAAKSIELQKY